MTVLLARNRQPPTTINASVRHAEFAAELVSLPSGLLARVCDAIRKLKVRHGAALRVRLGCMGVRTEYCLTRYSAGIRYGPGPPRFPQYGALASKLATQHAAGQGQCLNVPCVH